MDDRRVEVAASRWYEQRSSLASVPQGLKPRPFSPIFDAAMNGRSSASPQDCWGKRQKLIREYPATRIVAPYGELLHLLREPWPWARIAVVRKCGGFARIVLWARIAAVEERRFSAA